jgi:hypothetical protein
MSTIHLILLNTSFQTLSGLLAMPRDQDSVSATNVFLASQWRRWVKLLSKRSRVVFFFPYKSGIFFP